jgi:ubiquinone/menaquinone biosynthesis C-methylase UbiE
VDHVRLEESGVPETKHVDRVRAQFNRQADAYAEMQVVRDRRMLEFLAGISGVGPEDRVLDVACGPGFMTMAFAERAARVVGIDITDRFLESARAEAARRGLTNVTFLQGNVENLHFGPGSFRIALCRFAFHHFPGPTVLAGERVLPGRERSSRTCWPPGPGRRACQDRIKLSTSTCGPVESFQACSGNSVSR